MRRCAADLFRQLRLRALFRLLLRRLEPPREELLRLPELLRAVLPRLLALFRLLVRLRPPELFLAVLLRALLLRAPVFRLELFLAVLLRAPVLRAPVLRLELFLAVLRRPLAVLRPELLRALLLRALLLRALLLRALPLRALLLRAVLFRLLEPLRAAVFRPVLFLLDELRLLALLRPPFLADAVDFFLPRPDPDFLPPPVSLLTVAHARRSASFSLTPRLSYPSSMCSAWRFCLSV